MCPQSHLFLVHYGDREKKNNHSVHAEQWVHKATQSCAIDADFLKPMEYTVFRYAVRAEFKAFKECMKSSESK